MTLLPAFLLVLAATVALSLLGAAIGIFLDGWDARRDSRRRNQAHKL